MCNRTFLRHELPGSRIVITPPIYVPTSASERRKHRAERVELASDLIA